MMFQLIVNVDRTLERAARQMCAFQSHWCAVVGVVTPTGSSGFVGVSARIR
jgi:hypothetical protein